MQLTSKEWSAVVVDVDKFHRSIAKTLRAVASSEPNKSLQDLLFQFAEKHEVLEKECSLFNTSDQAILAVLDDSKKRLISPMRVRFSTAIAMLLPTAVAVL